MTMITTELWADDWFCSLNQRQKLLYLYLITICSKCGIFEVNMRKINFDLSNGVEQINPYTADEIFSFAGSRIQRVGESRGIVARYIEFNWMREEALNTDAPTIRGIVKELAKYGLDLAKVKAMTPNSKLRWKGEEDGCTDSVSDTVVVVQQGKVSEDDTLESQYEMWFNDFWKMYPGPRKTDKKKCYDKFVRILKKEKAPDHMFEKIMGGLNMWCASDDWRKDGGKFICAPLVWLNRERWDAEIKTVKTGTLKEKGAKYNEHSTKAALI